MPHNGPEELKEILDVVEACAKAMGLDAYRSDIERMAKRLLPYHGPDLFRLLWAIPNTMKGFPSADKIIERLQKGAVPPMKPHNFGEVVQEVFGGAPPMPKKEARRSAMNECLDAVLGKNRLNDPFELKLELDLPEEKKEDSLEFTLEL